MITVELTAAIDAAGTLQTFYLSDAQLVTESTDTPAKTDFVVRLRNQGTIGIHSFSDGRTGGATKLEIGEITIANVDGELDGWLNYGFDGRSVVIRTGTAGAAYPAGFTALFNGLSSGIEADLDQIIIRLQDKQSLLDVPACINTYGGTNSLPNGLDGTASDIKGARKPKCYGKVFNVSPLFVNTSKLTYQVNDGAVSDIAAVYDRGVAVTKGADYATSALLQAAAAPAAGTYVTCFAEGYFRLGTASTGQITADVVQGAAAGNRTVAQIIKLLAVDAGLNGTTEVSAADVTALDTANSSVIGIYLSDETTFTQAMDQVAASVGAWFGFDSSGVLRMGQLTAPSGTAVATFYQYEILPSGFNRRPAKDIGIPAWRYTLGYSKNYTVQPSDLAGAVAQDRRAWLAEEYRQSKSEDSSIKTQWKTAEEITADGLLTSAADADTEAARRLTMYKVRRDILDVPVALEVFKEKGLKLMDVVTITYPRFGCTSGKDFRLIGIRYELNKQRVVMTVWG